MVLLDVMVLVYVLCGKGDVLCDMYEVLLDYVVMWCWYVWIY